MIKIDLESRLKEQDKSLYWLAKETGIAYTTLWKLRDAKTDSINFRVLESICTALECEPADLIIMVPDQAKKSTKKGAASK